MITVSLPTAVYLALTLSLGSLSVLCTIIVLNVYFRSDVEEPIPGWLKKLTLNVLMRVVCYKHKCCCYRSRSTKVHPDGDQEPAQVIMVLEKQDDADQARNRKTSKKGIKKDAVISPEPATSSVRQAPVYSIVMEDYDQTLTWKELSVVLDRLFFVLFMSTIILSTALLLYAILAEWINVEVSSMTE